MHETSVKKELDGTMSIMQVFHYFNTMYTFNSTLYLAEKIEK